jgi:uncharacterized protein (DUF2267 family)
MKYDEFIAQVRRRARLETTEEAENATRATLQTLAERIDIDEVKDLVSQLPQELALYMQTPTTGIGESFSLDEFFHRVSEREGVALADATFHARVVTALLSEVVTVGEIEDVRAQLPPDFAKLFEVENEGEVPEIGEIVDVEE